MLGFSPVMLAALGTSNCHVLCMRVWITNKNWDEKNIQKRKNGRMRGDGRNLQVGRNQHSELPRLTQSEENFFKHVPSRAMFREDP